MTNSNNPSTRILFNIKTSCYYSCLRLFSSIYIASEFFFLWDALMLLLAFVSAAGQVLHRFLHFITDRRTYGECGPSSFALMSPSPQSIFLIRTICFWYINVYLLSIFFPHSFIYVTTGQPRFHWFPTRRMSQCWMGGSLINWWRMSCSLASSFDIGTVPIDTAGCCWWSAADCRVKWEQCFITEIEFRAILLDVVSPRFWCHYHISNDDTFE